MAKHSAVKFEDVHSFVDSILGDDVHAKRVYSMANATMGVMSSASLGIHAIGQGLADAQGLVTKPEERLRLLMGEFAKLVRKQPAFSAVFSLV